VEQFAAFAREEDLRMARALAALHGELEDQQWRVQQAEQRCRLLEKLEKKQLAGWEAEAAKELEELASDVFLARLSRSGRKGG